MTRNQQEILWRDIVPLEWDQQKYGTGFAQLDEQHQQLFSGLNSLIFFLKNSSAADEPENSRKIVELLAFLGKYAERHFQDEEAIFEACGHQMAEANKESHQMFLRKHAQYQQRLSQGTVTRSLLIQVHIFLQSWLLNHIVNIDTSLRACAAKAAAKSGRSEESKGAFSRLSAMFRRKP